MRIQHSILMCLSVLASLAQVPDKKDLNIRLSGGVAVIGMKLNTAQKIDLTKSGGAFALSMSYALSNTWSVGLNYDRIGIANETGVFDRARTTGYVLMCAYRPFSWGSSWVGIEGGLGVGITAFRSKGSLVYSRASGGMFYVGPFYARSITNGIGVMGSIALRTLRSDRLQDPDGFVLQQTIDGGPILRMWTLASTVGVNIRF